METLLSPPPGMSSGDFILVVIFLLALAVFILCARFRL